MDAATDKETLRKARKAAHNQQLLEDNWRDGELAQKALKFLADNRIVYPAFCKLADQVIANGKLEFAVASIWERMRWYLEFDLPVKYEFDYPNNCRAYIARVWLEEHPQYPIFFQLCSLRSQGKGGSRDEFGRSEEDIEWPNGDEPDFFGDDDDDDA